MLIGFYNDYSLYTESSKRHVDTITKQCRRMCPNARIVQMCNNKKAAENAMLYVDEVWEMDHTGDFSLNRLGHHIHALEEDDHYLALDIDVIVQADITDWFNHDFTVPCTYRPMMRNEKDLDQFLPGMFYNHGVLYSKNVNTGGGVPAKEMWQEMYNYCRDNPNTDWLGGQLAFKHIIEPWEGSRYKYLQLPECYNYTPEIWKPNWTDHFFAVHYKGATRKKWFAQHAEMLEHVV